MQRHDAGAEIEVFDPLEARLLEQRLQLLLVGMHTDGFGKITITFAVISDQFAEAWNDIE